MRVYLLGPNCCTDVWEYCGSTSCDITHLEQRQKGREKSNFIHLVNNSVILLTYYESSMVIPLQ